MKKILLLCLFVVSLLGVLKANDIITSTLPELKKDKRGYKLTPVVVFNKSTDNYETIYLKADVDGNLSVTNSDFALKNSTYTAGVWNTSGSLAVNFDVGFVSFKQRGNGVNTIDLGFGSGTIDFFVNNDNFAWELPKTKSNPTITYSLAAGTSIQYFIGGGN
jgi:hypothetical protein